MNIKLKDKMTSVQVQFMIGDTEEKIMSVGQRVWYTDSTGEERKARVEKLIIDSVSFQIDLNIKEDANIHRIRYRQEEEDVSDDDEYDFVNETESGEEEDDTRYTLPVNEMGGW